MVESAINPSTGEIDQIGISLNTANSLYIRLDGNSTTTASIPFAQGLNLPSGKTITFTDSGTGLDAFTIGSNGYSIPSKLTITSLGGTSPQLELIDTALYAVATSRMNVFGTAYTFTGITNQDGNDVLVVYNSQSSTSGTIRGAQLSARFDGSSNSSGQNFGFNAIAQHAGSGQLTRATTAGGLCANRSRVIVDTGGSGTVTLACGVSSHFSATSGVGNTTSEFNGYRAELPTNGNNTLTLYAGLRVMGASIGNAGLGTAYGVKIDQFVAGVTNYEIAIDKTGGIYFNTPSRAGLENIKSAASGTLDFTAGTSLNFIIGSTTNLALTSTAFTFTDAVDQVFGTSTGTKIGTSTSQKLAFYNSTPITQPAATTDLGTVLSNLGLRASGTAYPITTSGAVNFTGGVTIATTALTITDVNVILSTTTGTKIATATNQKLGIWNATPIVQPTTAVAAATFVANTSGIVDDSATWDGYTAGQVVKALRNIGLLA